MKKKTQTPENEKDDQELLETAYELFNTIYITDCFGVKDLVRYELICRELERRGYDIKETKDLEITHP